MEKLHIHSGKLYEMHIGCLWCSAIVADDPRYPLWKRLFAYDHYHENGQILRKTVFFSFSRLNYGKTHAWQIIFWFLMIHFSWV